MKNPKQLSLSARVNPRSQASSQSVTSSVANKCGITITKSEAGTLPVRPASVSASAVTTANGHEYLSDPARISAVIERLKPSKVEADEQINAESVNDGRLWAESQATALELTRLEAAGGAYGISYSFGSSAYSNAERFLFAIHPVFRRNRKEARVFWAQSIGDWRMPDDFYVFGFASGAMEVLERGEDSAVSRSHS